MFRFRLRTLLIVLALGPPVTAALWYEPGLIPLGLLLVLLCSIPFGLQAR